MLVVLEFVSIFKHHDRRKKVIKFEEGELLLTSAKKLLIGFRKNPIDKEN